MQHNKQYQRKVLLSTYSFHLNGHTRQFYPQSLLFHWLFFTFNFSSVLAAPIIISFMETELRVSLRLKIYGKYLWHCWLPFSLLFPQIISNQWMSAEYGLKNITLKEGVIPVWITIVIHENIKADKLFPYFRVDLRNTVWQLQFCVSNLICCWWKKCVFDFLQRCMNYVIDISTTPPLTFARNCFSLYFEEFYKIKLLLIFLKHKWEFFPFSCVNNISTLKL